MCGDTPNDYHATLTPMKNYPRFNLKTVEVLKQTIQHLIDENTLRLMLSTAPLPTWMKDFTHGQGIMVYGNDAFWQHYKVTPAEWLGRYDSDLWPKLPADVTEQWRITDEEAIKNKGALMQYVLDCGSLGMRSARVAKWRIDTDSGVFVAGVLLPGDLDGGA